MRILPQQLSQPIMTVMLLLAACIGAPIEEARAADAEAQKTAYLLSIKCYVANDLAATDRRYGDFANAQKFRAQAQKSYQYVWQLGRASSKSDALVQEDIDSYRAVMTGSFKREPKAFEQVRSQCVQFGLM